VGGRRLAGNKWLRRSHRRRHCDDDRPSGKSLRKQVRKPFTVKKEGVSPFPALFLHLLLQRGREKRKNRRWAHASDDDDHGGGGGGGGGGGSYGARLIGSPRETCRVRRMDPSSLSPLGKEPINLCGNLLCSNYVSSFSTRRRSSRPPPSHSSNPSCQLGIGGGRRAVALLFAWTVSLSPSSFSSMAPARVERGEEVTTRGRSSPASNTRSSTLYTSAPPQVRLM